ncbi:MAG: galactose mutarotase [Flavobacteriales bacterium]|nr:galactose mutarotase [Flavobacteriales bacterium]
MNQSVSSFGFLPDGKEAKLYTLEIEGKIKASFTDFGARLVSLWLPDREGIMRDIVLGYDSVSGYIDGKRYYGSNPGPFANRIKKASYVIEGNRVALETNEGQNQLHGGKIGFDMRFWDVEMMENSLRFKTRIPDGEAGRPGNLDVEIRYTLSENSLLIDYTAETDKPTHVNITHHSYFNLNKTQASSALNHVLFLDADKRLETDSEKIPTGNFLSVLQTPFDFSVPKSIILDFDAVPGGYDHCYVLNPTAETIAWLHSPETGLTMHMRTTLPGIQVYTGSAQSGTMPGKNGQIYPAHSSICLEPQFYPDSPNQSHFPSTLLLPGEIYQHHIGFSFSIQP